MRIALIVYLFLTAAMFCYVSGMCFRKRMARGAGTLELLIATLRAPFVQSNQAQGPVP